MAFNAAFYAGNRQRLGGKLAPNSIALFFSGWSVVRSGDADYPFFTNNNFYYLTGITDPEVTLAVVKTGDGELSCHLFINEVDPLLEKWVGKKIRKEEATQISGIDEVDYQSHLAHWLEGQTETCLYLDSEVPPHQKRNIEMALTWWSGSESADSAHLMQVLRNIKQDVEIAALRQAIAMTAEGIKAVRQNLKPGMMEYQVQAVFEYAIAMAGAQSVSFDTIVASGVHGPTLHYITNQDPIGQDDLVLLDLGARYEGYCGDISRTLAASGHFTKDQERVYASVLEAQKKLITLYTPGRPMAEIQEAAKELLCENLSRRGIEPPDGDIGQYYYHGVGHPLGLDTHDLGRQPGMVLATGMVITCEPGLYLADYGIGVRIEDDILVTTQGPVNLSPQIPKELDEI
ncbi:aminopeptidase P N-terminal domain-containing protein [Eubacterium aggregans]|uniref:aminopeptidase P N-terminal domain-containing protein n=1 Tax=Eubacterium aggregans TaxID=81409 RepID=UPI003F39FDCD